MSERKRVTAGLQAVAAAYKERDSQTAYADWRTNAYHPRHALGAAFHAQTRAALAKAFAMLDVDLAALTILDYGCGTGSWLRIGIDMGAQPQRFVGVDLSEQRLAYAQAQTPGASFCRVGGTLPFREGAFDLVFASLVFSSVGDRQLHAPLAAELVRVCKPRGAIVWLDLDRSHGKLHGFGIDDIIHLFPQRAAIPVDRLHPRYFRRFHRLDRLMNIAYNLTRAGCESTLYLLVPRHGHGHE